MPRTDFLITLLHSQLAIHHAGKTLFIRPLHIHIYISIVNAFSKTNILDLSKHYLNINYICFTTV